MAEIRGRKYRGSKKQDDTRLRAVFLLISVTLGFLIWITVVNISNPEVTRTKTVPLTVLNGKVLTDAGKSYSIQSGDTVTVSYQVRTRDAYLVDSDDFRVSVDLLDLYSVTGSAPVSIEVVGRRELIIGTPSVRPSTIRVLTEDLQNKSFTVGSRIEGAPAADHSVGSVTVEPESVMVSGPVSMVGRISSVGIEVDATGRSDDFSGTASPVFYDANGNEITFDEGPLTTDPEEIHYSVHMLRGKSLALQFEVSGSTAPGYRFTGAECSVKSVPVVGEEDAVESINELTVPGTALSIAGAAESRSVTVDLSQYLPAGVFVSGNATVTVLLKVEALNTRAFQLSLGNNITTSGRQDGLVYTLYPNPVSVELSGLPEELEPLTAEDLRAELDLRGMEPGTYTGNLSITAPAGTTIASVTPFSVIVTRESEGPNAVIQSRDGTTEDGEMDAVTAEDGETEAVTVGNAAEETRADGTAAEGVPEAEENIPEAEENIPEAEEGSGSGSEERGRESHDQSEGENS